MTGFESFVSAVMLLDKVCLMFDTSELSETKNYKKLN